ncbi:hypothetical protein [Paenibacillus dokdonensis]|uniref:hypothetical protein n=1 Tax=Paenibacillus dokdonensis TaxID=2567944 RepID=UPI001457D11F|nr:hypothetical protein [Paenibacillus dokdonensis]
MDYMSSNRMKFILISIIIVSLMALLVLTYFLLKKEDTRTTSYSCNELLTFSKQTLLKDRKISVLSATSLEENLSLSSLISEVIPSQMRVTKLVNESSNVVALANQMKSDVETDHLTIPKNACYVSSNTNDIAKMELSITQLPSTNVAVYNWVKTYRDYWGREFSTTNVVLFMNNYAIHVSINGSSNGTLSNPFKIFSGIKAKLTVYTLDNAQV